MSEQIQNSNLSTDILYDEAYFPDNPPKSLNMPSKPFLDINFTDLTQSEVYQLENKTDQILNDSLLRNKYVFVNQKLDYDDAVEYCRDKQMFLAFPTNNQENEILKIRIS